MDSYTAAPLAAIVALVLSSLLTMPLPALADSTPPGWRFYNEPKEPKPIKPKPPAPPSTPATTTTKVMSATEQMAWFHKQWNEAKAATFIDPNNEEKLHRFLTLNRYITSQTDITAMTFKKLLVENPELSYTKDHPTEQAARKTYLAAIEAKQENKVREMMRNGWGLFFVYEGEDALATQLAPSIQQFADRYQLDLLGISNDEVFAPGIRENRSNQGKITAAFTPAILLVNPNSGEMKPLAYGFISQTKLLSRFYNVATDFKDSNY